MGVTLVSNIGATVPSDVKVIISMAEYDFLRLEIKRLYDELEKEKAYKNSRPYGEFTGPRDEAVVMITRTSEGNTIYTGNGEKLNNHLLECLNKYADGYRKLKDKLEKKNRKWWQR